MRLSSSSYSLMQLKWLRYWCARLNWGSSPSPKAEPSEVYQQAGSRVIPSKVVTTGSSQRQPLVACGSAQTGWWANCRLVMASAEVSSCRLR